MHVKSPTILKSLFPSLVWEVKTSEKEIFLTFDDGPHPSITNWILDTLEEYNIKATFFCVGENVCKYPNVFNNILKRGHRVGNHSYNHLSGWKVKNEDYFNNISKAAELIDSNLFRPPYGRITPSQIRKLKHDFSIIMWSVLTYDFDNTISNEQIYLNSIVSTIPGSIVVFHDSSKAEEKLRYTLPKFLVHFSKLGYTFKVL